MSYTIGQIFINEYPPEAALWCNSHDKHIEPIEPDENGSNRYQIVNNEEPAPWSTEQIIASYTVAIQNALDEFAQQRNYDNIMSVCSYYGSKNPRFSAEAVYCLELRDNTWAKAYEILDDVLEGKRQVPTEQQLLEELPIGSASWNEVNYERS